MSLAANTAAPAMRTGDAISFSGVSLTYGAGTANQVQALKDISFDVPAGQFVSILGPSGCGKSTLLRLVAGFIQPNAGSVTVGSVDPLNARENGLLGVVFQQPVLLPWRNVMDNVSFLQELRHLPKAKRQEVAKRYIDLVGLRGFERHMPHQLSGACSSAPRSRARWPSGRASF